jgi:hypothetical protein
MPISQYPLGITIFTVHWSKDGGSHETRRINSVVAVAKARQLEASGDVPHWCAALSEGKAA